MSTKPKEQGLSLLDIGPLYEEVDFGQKKIRVFGVSAKGIFVVFQRFPQILGWFNGGKINIQSLIAEAPDAIAAIIAAGCGNPGDAAAEQIAGALPAETQLDIVEAIGRLTFKSGFGPFVQRMVALANAAKSVNYGRAADMKSPPASNPVSPPATEPSTSGP